MRLSWILFFLLVGLGSKGLWAQFEFDEPPIRYSDSEPNDVIAQLIEAIESRETELVWDDTTGWLPSLLNKLNVAPDSQTLVFSKTSMQIRHITPSNPRAIYFSDNVYVGYVPGGEVIELSAVDPKLGAIFYTVDQSENKPQIVRDESQCMTCHGTRKTKDVPGYLVRSVYASESGHPHYSMGTTTTDHSTDFRDRFGGWYVTGEHGELRHRGNAIAEKDVRDPINFEPGANRQRLPEKVRSAKYLSEGSDLVALMVLEHQTQMHNLITRAAYETRQALFYQKTLNEALGRDAGFMSESTNNRINSAANQLLRYLLFRDEFKLTSPISGNPEFVRRFADQAKRDSSGRSLRDLDLNERLFKLPCSFLIQSESFDQLPDVIRGLILEKLVEGLTAGEPPKDFQHLTNEQRRGILEVLQDTKPEFAALLPQD
jgi:hypothetical protein